MNYRVLVFLFHIFIVGPLYIILGKYHDHPMIKDNISLWNSMIVIGIFMILYHSYLLYNFYRSY
jgi:hypothetical protein